LGSQEPKFLYKTCGGLGNEAESETGGGRRGLVYAEDPSAIQHQVLQGPQANVFTAFSLVVHIPGKEGVNNHAEVGKDIL